MWLITTVLIVAAVLILLVIHRAARQELRESENRRLQLLAISRRLPEISRLLQERFAEIDTDEDGFITRPDLVVASSRASFQKERELLTLLFHRIADVGGVIRTVNISPLSQMGHLRFPRPQFVYIYGISPADVERLTDRARTWPRDLD